MLLASDAWLFAYMGCFVMIGSSVRGRTPYEDFRASWCRQRRERYDWNSIIRPCLQYFTDFDNHRITLDRFKTNVKNSEIFHLEIRPAKEFSRLFIRTWTSSGLRKGFGGDAWRVNLIGPSSVAATVYDNDDGTYEALFLLAEPGRYEIEAILDYSLCDGMRDPPIDWFLRAHCSGKHKNVTLSRTLYANMSAYIDQPLKTKEGNNYEFLVEWPRWNEFEFQNIMRAANSECQLQCNVMWDGFGRWIGKSWVPFMNSTARDYQEQHSLKKDFHHPRGRGIFTVYGDSLSYYFFKDLSSRRRVMCSQVFNKCSVSYNWIYPMALYNLKETCQDIALNVPKVLHFFRQITRHPSLGVDSGLLFNVGAHYVKTTSFSSYQEVIQDLVKEIKEHYHGKAIWKTSTAIHDQTADIMGAFRRFTTNQRIQLYNAYANAVMCRNNITILDLTPLTQSYPGGTVDGIHYENSVFESVESLLENYFAYY